MKRRVVVTGLGIITPLGTGVLKNWQALCEGQSGIDLITAFDASKGRTKIAGQVKEFNPVDFMEKKTARRASRFIQFAAAASRMAVEDAKLIVNSKNENNTGVSIASALGGMDSFEKNHALVLEGNRDRVSPFFITSMICNMAPAEVAIQFGAKGPNMCSVTACAAGTHAIGDAFRAVQYGEADVMLAGGAEACITPVVFAGFDAIRAMSVRNDAPAKAVRPFDKYRDGFVCSEGSGVMILEELERALNRGARIYAEVSGYGHSCDAYHITAPDPEGKGAINCIMRSLEDAGMSPDAVDYINAHGTSTQLNDLTETKAIKTVFGARAHQIPISSNKSMIGHLFGAAGAVEAIFSILTIKDGIIPPTINYDSPDPECDLDYVPNVARKASVNTVLSNSFGFGGANGCLILSRLSA